MASMWNLVANAAGRMALAWLVTAATALALGVKPLKAVAWAALAMSAVGLADSLRSLREPGSTRAKVMYVAQAVSVTMAAAAAFLAATLDPLWLLAMWGLAIAAWGVTLAEVIMVIREAKALPADEAAVPATLAPHEPGQVR